MPFTLQRPMGQFDPSGTTRAGTGAVPAMRQSQGTGPAPGGMPAPGAPKRTLNPAGKIKFGMQPWAPAAAPTPPTGAQPGAGGSFRTPAATTRPVAAPAPVASAFTPKTKLLRTTQTRTPGVITTSSYYTKGRGGGGSPNAPQQPKTAPVKGRMYEHAGNYQTHPLWSQYKG